MQALRVARGVARVAARTPVRQHRPAVACGLRRGFCAEAAEPVPPPSADISPKIRGIADQIAQLNLLEVSELCSVLKTELNIPDAAPVGFAAPMVAAGPAAPADAGEGPAADAAEDAGPSVVTLALKGFKDDSKVKVIKEIKKIMSEADPKFNLASAKKFVESLPQVVKADIAKDVADQLQEALTAAGGEVEVK